MHIVDRYRTAQHAFELRRAGFLSRKAKLAQGSRAAVRANVGAVLCRNSHARGLISACGTQQLYLNIIYRSVCFILHVVPRNTACGINLDNAFLQLLAVVLFIAACTQGTLHLIIIFIIAACTGVIFFLFCLHLGLLHALLSLAVRGRRAHTACVLIRVAALARHACQSKVVDNAVGMRVHVQRTRSDAALACAVRAFKIAQLRQRLDIIINNARAHADRAALGIAKVTCYRCQHSVVGCRQPQLFSRT